MLTLVLATGLSGNKEQQKIMSTEIAADAVPFTEETRNTPDNTMNNFDKMNESSDSSDSHDMTSRIVNYPTIPEPSQNQNIRQQVVIQNPRGVVHLGPVYNLNIGQAFGQVNTTNQLHVPQNNQSHNDNGQASNNPRENDRPPKEEMRPLWESNRIIEQEELSQISRHMGANWRAVGNGLKFNWAQLDQFEADTKTMADAAHRMLFRWVQWKDQKATVVKLTKVLFIHGEYDAIRVLKP